MGETSRTCYTRLSEHLASYRAAAAARLPALPPDGHEGTRGKRRSWMWDHVRDHHEGVLGEDIGMGDFNVRVTGQFRKCLYRQVDEDIRMQMCEAEGGTVLSKNEWYTPKSVQPIFKQL